MKKWPIAPAVLEGNIFESHQQVIEADVAYVKDFAKLHELDAEQLKHLALLAHFVYGSTDLVVRCLLQLVADGAVPERVVAAYAGSIGRSLATNGVRSDR